MSASAHASDLVPVRVIDLPVPLYQESRERHEGLLRELALLALREEEAPAAVPKRLLAFGEDLRQRYGGLTGSAQDVLDAAVERGDATVDLDYEVPPAAADVAEAYLALLDEVDEYCREGDLLTLAPHEGIVAFRRWFLGEFVRQPRGEPPRPWSELVPGG